MILDRTVAPVAAVTLAEAKAHLRVLDDAEDSLIQAYLDAAVAWLDGPKGVLGQCIMTQTWTIRLVGWSDPVLLPVEPVQSVAITYRDAAETAQTLSPLLYDVAQAFGASPALFPSLSMGWPGLGNATRWPVTVTVVAGRTVCPTDIRMAVLLMTGHWYQNREAVVAGTTVADLPMAVDALIAPFRRVAI